MGVAVITSNSAEELYNISKALVQQKNVMYESFLYPYVDALVMSKPEKSGLYFSNKLIINLDFLKSEDFEVLMREKNIKYEIKSQIQNSDVFFRPEVDECFKYRVERYFAFSRPYELRASARNMCAFAEIADRILGEYSGSVITSSINEIFFKVPSQFAAVVSDRLREAETAIYG